MSDIKQAIPLQTKWYGWRPDLPDHRDYRFSASRKKLAGKGSLRDRLKTIFDQLALGSCTANMTANQVWAVDKTSPSMPSRLFIYYQTRVLEGTVAYDSGASTRNAIKSVVKYGYCPEASWPYRVGSFATKPSAAATRQAAAERALEYGRIDQTLPALKAVLAAGFFVGFGFSVYDSFESDAVARTGKVPLPKAAESLLGGHAVLLGGWDDAAGRFDCVNSWGRGWGDGGWFTLPYDYVLDPNLASDFWQVRSVT